MNMQRLWLDIETYDTADRRRVHLDERIRIIQIGYCYEDHNS